METEEVCNTSHLEPKYFKIVLGQNTSFLSLIFWAKTGDILCVSKILGGESLEFTQKSLLEAKSCPSRGRRTEHGFPSPRAAPRGSPGHNTLKATRRKGGRWKYMERWFLENTSSPGGWYPSPSLRNTPTFTRELLIAIDFILFMLVDREDGLQKRLKNSPSTLSNSPCRAGLGSVGNFASAGSVQAKRQLSCCRPEDVIVIVILSRRHICYLSSSQACIVLRVGSGAMERVSFLLCAPSAWM